ETVATGRLVCGDVPSPTTGIFDRERRWPSMVMRRLLRYLKPHRKPLVLAFLLLLLATGADVAGPLLVKVFIDDYLTPKIFPLQPLVLLAGAYILLLIAGVVMEYFQEFAFHRIALRVIQQLRVDVFGKVQHLGLSFFDRMPG